MPPLIQPSNEGARLEALYGSGLTDASNDPAFEAICRLARTISGAAVAMVSLVDRDRVRSKSRVGANFHEISREQSLCARTIASKQGPLLIHDMLADREYTKLDLARGEPSYRFYCGYPLAADDGHNIGALCILDQCPRLLSRDQKTALQDLADLAAQEIKIRSMAVTDPLTGALNRRVLDTMLQQAQARFLRRGEPFSFVLLDVDNFKHINDSFGHDVGDLVLIELTRTLFQCVRDEDAIFRLGGEEFGVILSGADAPAAKNAAERFRKEIAAISIPHPTEQVRFAASLGVATAQLSRPASDHLVRDADDAMYEAKRCGRNRVILSEAGAKTRSMPQFMPVLTNPLSRMGS
jgi:diguanylate cyclase (GGDEF)-like protein